jgi:hypothetical protein
MPGDPSGKEAHGRGCPGVPDRAVLLARYPGAHSVGPWAGVHVPQDPTLAGRAGSPDTVHRAGESLGACPGRSPGNGYIESFNGKLRDELLKREIFYTLQEAQVLVERWRLQYNHRRPHSSLGNRPPAPEADLVPSLGSRLATAGAFGLALNLVQRMGAAHGQLQISQIKMALADWLLSAAGGSSGITRQAPGSPQRISAHAAWCMQTDPQAAARSSERCPRIDAARSELGVRMSKRAVVSRLALSRQTLYSAPTARGGLRRQRGEDRANPGVGPASPPSHIRCTEQPGLSASP